MQLLEVSLAAALFSAATTGSLQLWAAGMGQQHTLASRSELIERMELDRLQLQARWRQALPRAEVCPSDAAPMLAAAQQIETPPQLSRQLEPLRDGPGVRVVWSVPAQPGLVRSRWFTPAGLGLC
jgi:type II secretory pathway component PulJ